MKVNVILKSLICAVSLYTANVGFGACEYQFDGYFKDKPEALFDAKVKDKVFRATVPTNFDAEIVDGKIKIPETQPYSSYDRQLDVKRLRFDIEKISPDQNWKFVLVKGVKDYSLRVGEKGLFGKIKKPIKRGLHHPTLAGFDNYSTAKKVIAAGVIKKDTENGDIYLMIDSGNYGLAIEKSENKSVQKARAAALVNLYDFLYDQDVITYIEEKSIEVEESTFMTSDVLVLGLK